MKILTLLLAAILALPGAARADQDVTGFRVGACVNVMVGDCAVAGVQTEYALERFAFGASVGILGLGVNGRTYLPWEFGPVRPFVSAGTILFIAVEFGGELAAGAGIGADLHVWKLVVRGQVQASNLELGIPHAGGDVLFQF